MIAKKSSALNKDQKNKLQKEGVVLAYLYGSEARGEAIKESDVDIAILFDKKIKEDDYLKKIFKISNLFNDVYPSRDIDIAILNQASPLFKQNAIIEGKELYCRSQWERILFENRTLHEYEDTRHLRNIYNYYLNLRLKNL
jgi:hypothetical protein